MSIPGAADASFTQYLCRLCDHRIVLSTTSAAAAGELSCPECCSDTLEEVNAPPPHTILPFAFNLTLTASSPPGSSSSSTAAPPSNLSNFITNFLGLDHQDGHRARSSSGSGAATAARTATPENETESFDRLVFFQNYLRGLEEQGNDIQILLDGRRVNHASLTGNLDQDLDQLIQDQIDHPSHFGTPATSSALSMLSGVDAMPAESAQCPVCQEELSTECVAKQMPCKHIYHNDCILEWLKIDNSCPICRFELLTDDPDHECIKASNPQPNVVNATTAGSESCSTTEEREEARVVRRVSTQTSHEIDGDAGSSSRDRGSQDEGAGTLSTKF